MPQTAIVNCVQCKKATKFSSSQSISSSESLNSIESTSTLNNSTNCYNSNKNQRQILNYTSSGLIAIITMEFVTLVTLLIVALTFSRSSSLQLNVLNDETTNNNNNSKSGNSSNFIIDSSNLPSVYNTASASSSSPHHLPFTSGPRVNNLFTSSSNGQITKPAVKLTGKLAFLRREMLKNTSVTCNDGTTAGYYIRQAANGSKKWLIYLEGGGHCFSRESCHQRWIRVRPLMSSAHWPMMRSSKYIKLMKKGRRKKSCPSSFSFFFQLAP